jgi:hypothetical protein
MLCTNGRLEKIGESGRIDGGTDRWVDGWMDEWLAGRTVM